MKKKIERIKDFFAATSKYPGLGLYIGCGKYAGFIPSCDRYGLIINLGWFWIMFISYDFVASSREVMNEVMDKRREIQNLHLMYRSKTPRRR